VAVPGLLTSLRAMTQGIDEGEIDSLAALARLSLPKDERDTFVRQMDAIVGYLAKLQAVDVDAVPEYVAPLPEAAPLRDDVATAASEAEAILAGCPQTRDGLVIVPRFVDG
jgi:aspartyl-tRNA(Asn)/glutamyl-tRNA(Gln) amidotransferase subunit C